MFLILTKINIMKLLKFLILTLIFLLPLFWLPFSFEIFEFNKFYLLFFGSWFLILIWILKQILKDKEIRFCWNTFDFLVLIFILVAFFSFIFSKDKISGLFGTYGRTNDGILALLSFFALYILVRNNLAVGEIKISEIFNSLFFASFLVLLWALIHISFLAFGVLQRIPFLKNFVMNPASASIFGLAVFFSLIFVWVLARLLIAKERKIIQVFYIIFIALNLVLLLLFDITVAWILLALSFIFFIFLTIKDRIFREDVGKLFFPLLFLFLVIVFSFLNFRALIFNLTGKVLFPNILQETVLSQKNSWQIALRSATSGIKNIFLGSGPATFLENFTKFRPDSFKKDGLWQVRFNMAGNYFSEILVFFGSLGAIIFSIILLWLLALVVFKKGATEIIPLKTFLLFTILLPIFTFQNMVLGGIFWLGLAIGANLISTKEKRYPIQGFPEITLIFETITVTLILLFIFCFSLGIRFYFADYYYQKGFLEPDLDKKIEYFQKSANNFNRYQPYYQMALSQVLISKVQVEMQKENPNQQLIQNQIFLALDAAKKAFELSPRLPYIENLANIYRDLIRLASGAEDWAIKKYQEAHSLDPKYPLHFVEIGKILIAKADILTARENFEKALELVPDLPQAKIQLALILDREGKGKEAISELEKLAIENPFSSETLFYLGVLYYNNDETDRAIESFQRAIAIFPDYSNARYLLALSFEKKGDYQKALEELKIIEIVNPENAILKQKIKEINEKLKGKEQKERGVLEREELVPVE